MSNIATTAGIAAVNKGRQIEVESKAQCLINRILGNQKSIVSYGESIAIEREDLAKIAGDVITQQSVMGAAFTGDLNPNQVTIANAIKKLNDAKQEQIALASQIIINRITNHQLTIAALEKQNEEYRKQLGELSADVVTETQVLS